MSVTASNSVTIKFTSDAIIAAVMDVNSPVNVRHGDSNTDIQITSTERPVSDKFDGQDKAWPGVVR